MAPTTRAEIYEDLKERRRRGEQAGEALPPTTAGRPLRDVSRTSAASMMALEIYALADRVFGDESKAEAWLERPNASMSGQRPIDLMQDQLGAAVVRESLEQIDSGIFA
ncbi:putative toxin-antitoxin system antitoxin component (TIGR02293 family) [Rhodopseudomonas rhenobacensis]|uniref:Putative toxin-antitoxin system antitoxin component (TIGR02293 family) n=1 Tax=Rhodopseudomonas rhenobacensis TaxID=87461 RepID=A0A7W7Z884_9BRAD|nr:MbcA/ParS/Xre antitoxin family protein [Rhodopseudomonas rhenobacensis]MBB5049846.1 putative toxin-antitoxin system antitoxin component (TIGR02293 family) [Rhodopseudomonas rhenobacensis]